MAELSAREQLFLELMNRARMDPAGEALRYGLADLNAGLPAGTIDTSAKQVLAPNAFLTDAARVTANGCLIRTFFLTRELTARIRACA